MKEKIYIAPAMQVVQVNATSIVATSKLDVDTNKTTGTQFTKDQGSWGDIWGSDDDDE